MKHTASEKTISALVEFAPDAIILADRDGNIVFVNSQTEKMFGFSKAELLGKTLEVLLPERFRRSHVAHRAGYAAAPRPRPMGSGLTLFGRRSTGAEFPVDVTLSHLETEDGFFIISAIRDISERRRAEELLQSTLKELADFKAALDEHAILAITDPQGRITYANEQFCRLSKYSREELLGQDHRILNSGYHAKEFMRQMWGTITAGRVWRGEVRNRAKDGSFYWVDATIVPFLGDDGKPARYATP